MTRLSRSGRELTVFVDEKPVFALLTTPLTFEALDSLAVVLLRLLRIKTREEHARTTTRRGARGVLPAGPPRRGGRVDQHLEK